MAAMPCIAAARPARPGPPRTLLAVLNSAMRDQQALVPSSSRPKERLQRRGLHVPQTW